MGKRVDRSAAKLSWRERVLRAIKAQKGKSFTRQNILDSIARQKIPGRSATWKQTVSRTLQEIRDAGAISFDGEGHYYTSGDIDTAAVLKRLEGVLEASFVVDHAGSSAAVAPSNQYEAGHWHHYTVAVEPVEEADGEGSLASIIETLSQATNALGKWYTLACSVAIFVQVLRKGEAVGYQWISLAWAKNPYVSSEQLRFKMLNYSTDGKYEVTELIAKVGWRVRES